MGRFKFFASDEMLVAIGLWICTLPLILLLALPTIGVLGTSVVSLTMLALILAICW